VNPVAVAHRKTTAPDGVLVQEAAAGGGASYAALYDRYSEQVYNYCLRLTGSPDDAADATQDAFVNVLGRLHRDDSPVLDFSAYLFAAARNESYALMRRRSRTQLSDEPPERALPEPDVETDPERAALLHDSQESVRLANAELVPRHREVLALREVAGRSYEEIGQIMGISENAAAQLIWRARSKLKGALTAGAVASVVATSEDCETAQVLINRLQDDEPITDAEHEWLDDHLEHCGKCRAARGMIFEVAASYRLWMPVAVLATMKADVLAAAGNVVGADWTSAHLAGSGAGAGGGGGAHVNGAHAGRFAKRPRGAQAAAGAAVTAGIMAAVGVFAIGLGHDDSTVRPSAAPAKDSAPAKSSKSSPSARPDKAAASAASSSALGIHPTRRVIPDQPVTGPNVGSPDASPRQDGPRGEGPRSETPRPDTPRGNPPGDAPKPKPAPRGGQPETPTPPVSPPGNQPVTPNPPPGKDPGNPGGTGPPPPATGGDCSWAGHGIGPGGCPPGHGGTPPGQGGTPPGQAKRP
jgi:RNA polymerase sigma factor (sigma-70 family)